MMDYGALPPEINSARMYSGAGSAPMLAAAAAWDGVATELNSTAALYQSVVGGLVSEGWLGPASTSMVAAVSPYMTWMKLTGAGAEQTAAQATAGAAAYEAAFAATVPPPAVAANRAQLQVLVATNVLGQNTPAIAANEGLYAEMWAQDAAAMYGYAASSATASKLPPFSQPPQITDPSGQSNQNAAVAQVTSTSAASGTQETLSQVTSALPNSLQSLASPVTSTDATSSLTSGGLWDFLDSNFLNGWVSAGYINPAIIQQTVTASMADINAVTVGAQPQSTELPPMGSGSGNETWEPIKTPGTQVGSGSAPPNLVGAPSVGVSQVSVGTNQAATVGRLSVPQSWTTVAQVENHAGAAIAGGGWNSTALPESPSSSVPGMPGMPATAASGRHFGNGPRYGFHVTVMPRPPAAG